MMMFTMLVFNSPLKKEFPVALEINVSNVYCYSSSFTWFYLEIKILSHIL